MLSLQAMEQMLMLMLMLMMMMAGGAYGQTVCHAVATDQVTTVACLFGRDVSQHNFNVQFFPTPDSDPDIILVCNRRSSGGLLCKKGRGVDFDEDQLVITQLLLTAPPVNDQQTGQYLCQIVGVDGHLRRCNVTYKNDPVAENPAIIFPVSIVGISLFALCFMAVIITCLVCCIRREKIRDWVTEPMSERWRKAMDASKCKRGFPLPDANGMPQHFYNMGWRDALQPDEKTDANRGSGRGDLEVSKLVRPSTSGANAQQMGSKTKAEQTGSQTKAEQTGSRTKAEQTGSKTKAEQTGSKTKAEQTGSKTTGSKTKVEQTGSQTKDDYDVVEKAEERLIPESPSQEEPEQSCPPENTTFWKKITRRFKRKEKEDETTAEESKKLNRQTTV